MISVIAFENGAGERSVKSLINALNSIGQTEIILVSSIPKIELAGATVLYSNPADIAKATASAIAKAQSSRVLFIDAAAQLSAEQVAVLIAETSATSSGITYFPLSVGAKHSIDANFSTSQLVATLTDNHIWPVAAVSAATKVLESAKAIEGDSSREILAKLLVESSTNGEEVNESDITLKINASEGSFSLTSEERARLLNFLVQGSYIEDLFPNNDWKTHGEESAALCYHNLAAIFIKLGALEFAIDCLNLGDRFEDSPRSLALKGIIAESKGQTLEGVARLVASLQQYELRKKSNSKHYVSFNPSDIEKINVSLQEGLEALNKRDNSSAMTHFREAVFNFDSFYQDWGLSRK